MQTFLPYPEFARCAAALDDRRLGKQRVEALQILNALRGTTGGWLNHPAVKMWRGYEQALVHYALAMCDEWMRRGYADTVRAQLEQRYSDLDPLREVEMPPWLGSPEFHHSHRSNLVRKDVAFYQARFPDADPAAPYVWPA